MENSSEKLIFQNIKEQQLKKISKKLTSFSSIPKLVIFLVGNNDASKVYVKNKINMCKKLGIEVELKQFPTNVSQTTLIESIKKQNRRRSVSGIFVQFPLPKHIDEISIVSAIDPSKDVDGLHELNLGKVLLNDKSVCVPCTPSGIMQLLEYLKVDLSGKNVCIIGRSNIVGKPLSLLMINAGATVTVCNSKTKNLKAIMKQSDVIITAIGRAKYFTKDYFSNKKQIVIDVGINRVNGKIYGDVDFDNVKEKVKFISPVPGGVGVLTVINLMNNIIKTYENQHGGK